MPDEVKQLWKDDPKYIPGTKYSQRLFEWYYGEDRKNHVPPPLPDDVAPQAAAAAAPEIAEWASKAAKLASEASDESEQKPHGEKDTRSEQAVREGSVSSEPVRAHSVDERTPTENASSVGSEKDLLPEDTDVYPPKGDEQEYAVFYKRTQEAVDSVAGIVRELDRGNHAILMKIDDADPDKIYATMLHASDSGKLTKGEKFEIETELRQAVAKRDKSMEEAKEMEDKAETYEDKAKVDASIALSDKEFHDALKSIGRSIMRKVMERPGKKIRSYKAHAITTREKVAKLNKLDQLVGKGDDDDI